ncbi:hypothetical protein ACP6PU_004267, partial [Cronobacter dublinensis]
RKQRNGALCHCCLTGAGCGSGRSVTVRITEGCLAIIADNNEVQELREELYKVKQVVKAIKDVVL